MSGSLTPTAMGILATMKPTARIAEVEPFDLSYSLPKFSLIPDKEIDCWVEGIDFEK